jgi:hypothetical protein
VLVAPYVLRHTPYLLTHPGRRNLYDTTQPLRQLLLKAVDGLDGADKSKTASENVEDQVRLGILNTRNLQRPQ